MFSKQLPIILSFIYRHTERVGGCCFRFDIRKGGFYSTKSGRRKCITSFIILSIYILFAMIRIVQAYLSSSPDFAICFALLICLCFMGVSFIVGLGLASEFDVCKAINLVYK